MQTRRVWLSDKSNRQTRATRHKRNDIRQEKAAIVETRADEVMALVSKMASGKISLARDVHCCPTILLLVPDQRPCIVKNMRTYSHI